MPASYRVRAFSHAFFDGIEHTLSIRKAVSPESLGAVIIDEMATGAVRVVVEDEAEWVAIEAELAAEG